MTRVKCRCGRILYSDFEGLCPNCGRTRATMYETQEDFPCSKCVGTGVIDDGNNALPCKCAAGDSALFNISGFGRVTGAFANRHCHNDSPEPMTPYPSGTSAKQLEYRIKMQTMIDEQGPMPAISPVKTEEKVWTVPEGLRHYAEQLSYGSALFELVEALSPKQRAHFDDVYATLGKRKT